MRSSCILPAHSLLAALTNFFPKPVEPRKFTLQHGVAAVREPLVVAVVAPRVAPPRAAVDEEHHRQRVVRLPVAVGVRARREREVRDERQAVARGDDDGVIFASFSPSSFGRCAKRKSALCFARS